MQQVVEFCIVNLNRVLTNLNKAIVKRDKVQEIMRDILETEEELEHQQLVIASCLKEQTKYKNILVSLAQGEKIPCPLCQDKQTLMNPKYSCVLCHDVGVIG